MALALWTHDILVKQGIIPLNIVKHLNAGRDSYTTRRQEQWRR